MSVNLIQYRGVTGVFNSRFIHIKQRNIFKNAMLFTSFLIFLLISSSLSFIDLFQMKYRFISSSVVRISHISVY